VSRSSCRDGFDWPAGRDGDDDDDADDYDHPGRGSLSSARFWGFDSLEAPQLERTRSPPRRYYTQHGHARSSASLRLAFEMALKTNPPADGATPARLGAQTFIDKACRIMDMLHAATTTPGGGNMRVDCVPGRGHWPRNKPGPSPARRRWSWPYPH
jgi:hypothetical protein